MLTYIVSVCLRVAMLDGLLIDVRRRDVLPGAQRTHAPERIRYERNVRTLTTQTMKTIMIMMILI